MVSWWGGRQLMWREVALVFWAVVIVGFPSGTAVKKIRTVYNKETTIYKTHHVRHHKEQTGYFKDNFIG
jgi:hypothetical protein